MRLKYLLLALLFVFPLTSFAAYSISQGGTATSSFNKGVIWSDGGYSYLYAKATSSLGLPTFADLLDYFKLSDWYATTTWPSSNLTVNGTITLGGVPRSSWPSGGGGGTDVNWSYNPITDQLQPATSTSGIKVNGLSSIAGYFSLPAWYSTTTDGLAEGLTNKYYSNALVQAFLNTISKGYFFSTTSADYWGNTKGYLTSFTETDPIWTADKPNYLTSANAANTYITQASTSATYLSQNSATANYLTQSNAASTYITQASTSATYLSQASASANYQPKGSYLTSESDPYYTAASSTILRSGTSSDTLTEGLVNKFYTQARVWSDIWASSTLATILNNSISFYNTPSTRITAGTGLSWSGNTLNATGGGGGSDSHLIYDSGTDTLTPATSTTGLVINGNSTFGGATTNTVLGKLDIGGGNYIPYINFNSPDAVGLGLNAHVGLMGDGLIVGSMTSGTNAILGIGNLVDGGALITLTPDSSNALYFNGATGGYNFDSKISAGDISGHDLTLSGNIIGTTTVAVNDQIIRLGTINVGNYQIGGKNPMLYAPTGIITVPGAGLALQSSSDGNANFYMANQATAEPFAMSYIPANKEVHFAIEDGSGYINNGGSYIFHGTTTAGCFTSNGDPKCLSNNPYNQNLNSYDSPQFNLLSVNGITATNATATNLRTNSNVSVGGNIINDGNTFTGSSKGNYLAGDSNTMHGTANTFIIGGTNYATGTKNSLIVGKGNVMWPISSADDNNAMFSVYSTTTGSDNLVYGAYWDLEASHSAVFGNMYSGLHYTVNKDNVFIIHDMDIGIGTTSPNAKLDVVGWPGSTAPIFQVSTLSSSYATTTALQVNSNGQLLVKNTGALDQLIVTGTSTATNLKATSGSSWSGYGACYLNDGTLGHCTSVLAINGQCTCAHN